MTTAASGLFNWVQSYIEDRDVKTVSSYLRNENYNQLFCWLKDHRETDLTELFQGIISNEGSAFLKSVQTFQRALVAYAIQREVADEKKLSANEAFRCALVVQYMFRMYPERKDYTYLFRGFQHVLPRAVIVDFSKKEFYVLSKKFGRFQRMGICKKASNATRIRIDDGQFRLEHLVRIVNRKQSKILPSEIEFERAFGHPHVIHEYDGFQKCQLIKDLYEFELDDFLPLKRTSLQLQALCHSDILQICVGVSLLLLELHLLGVVHGDIKSRNVCLRRIEGKIYVLLIDFGDSFAPTGGFLRKSPKNSDSYATACYTAPERLKKDTVMNFQAEDTYALGLLLYELAQNMVPQVLLRVYDTIMYPEVEELRAEALKLQEELHLKLARSPMKLDPHLARLVDPNPAQRASCLDFLKGILKIDAPFFEQIYGKEEFEQGQKLLDEISGPPDLAKVKSLQSLWCVKTHTRV